LRDREEGKKKRKGEEGEERERGLTFLVACALAEVGRGRGEGAK